MKESKYIVSTGNSIYRMSALKFNIKLPDNATLAVAYKTINEADRVTSLIDRSDDEA